MVSKRIVLLGIFSLSVAAAFAGTLWNLRGDDLQGQLASGASQVVDDGDTSFRTNGKGWQTFQHNLGYKGDISSPTSPADLTLGATWTFANVSAGQYKFFVTFKAYSLLTNQAPYVIRDGTSAIGSATINQKVDPSGNTFDGKNWMLLGTFTVKGPTASITLSRPPSLSANGVIADAARIERVGGTAPAAPTAAPGNSLLPRGAASSFAQGIATPGVQQSSARVFGLPVTGTQTQGTGVSSAKQVNNGSNTPASPSVALGTSYMPPNNQNCPIGANNCSGCRLGMSTLECGQWLCTISGKDYDQRTNRCICRQGTGCPDGNQDPFCECAPITCPPGYHLGDKGSPTTCLPDSVCGDSYLEYTNVPREYCELDGNQGCPPERTCSTCQSCLVCGDTLLTNNEECETDYTCASGKSCSPTCTCTDSSTPLTANVTTTLASNSRLATTTVISNDVTRVSWSVPVRSGELYDVYVATRPSCNSTNVCPEPACPSNFWKIYNGSQEVRPLLIPFGNPLCYTWPDPLNRGTVWIRLAQVPASSSTIRVQHEPTPLPINGNPNDPARRTALATSIRLVKVTPGTEVPAPLGVTLIDDGDQGFSVSGTYQTSSAPPTLPWSSTDQGQLSFGDDFVSPSYYPSWAFTVSPNSNYRVLVSYRSSGNTTYNRTYSITDGWNNSLPPAPRGQELGPVTIDGRNPPDGGWYRGVQWKDIGSFTVRSSRLTITGKTGFFGSDAIRIERTSGPVSSRSSAASSVSSAAACAREGEIITEMNMRLCCTGLVLRPSVTPSGNQCPDISLNSVCTLCGNGTCGFGENFCNCLADCPRPASSSSVRSQSSASSQAWTECPTSTLCTKRWANNQCNSLAIDCAPGSSLQCDSTCGNSSCSGQCCRCVGGSSSSSRSSASASSVATCSAAPWTACPTGYFCGAACAEGSCWQGDIFDCPSGQQPQYVGTCGNTTCSGRCGRCVGGSSSSSVQACIAEGQTGHSIPTPGDQCCVGLQTMPTFTVATDGSCIGRTDGSFYCTALCGNGQCVGVENACNCPADCQQSLCGNGQVDTGEQCDGSTTPCQSGQSCTLDCQCATEPPSSIQWQMVGNSYLVSTLTDYALFGHGSSLYLVGGMDFWGATKNELRSTDGLSWTSVASLPQPLANAASVQTEGSALLLGGLYNRDSVVHWAFDTPNLLTIAFRSNPALALPVPRYDGAALRMGTRTFFLGGFYKATPLGGSLLGSLLGALIGQTAVPYPSNEIYMHNGTSWTRVQPDLPFHVTKNDAFSLGGKLFILDRSNPRKVYMSENGTAWAQVSTLPAATSDMPLLMPTLHKGAIWLLGKSGTFAGSAVATTDGRQWQTVTGAFPSDLNDFRPDSAVSFKDELWVLGTVSDYYIGGNGRNGKVLKTGAAGGPVCGNGHIEGEACDDGNTANGDGCDQSCHIEQGWICGGTTGQQSVCSHWIGCDDGFSCSGNPFFGNDNAWHCGFTGGLEPGCHVERNGASCGNDEWCQSATCQKIVCDGSSSSASSSSSSSSSSSVACAQNGQKVYGSSQFGPTVCCSKNAGIKPNSTLAGNMCISTNDGSKGTCVDNWWQTCGNGTCATGEDKCSCPADCSIPWTQVGPPHHDWTTCNAECASRGKTCAQEGCTPATAWNGTVFSGGEKLLSNGSTTVSYACDNAWGTLNSADKNYCCCTGETVSSSSSSSASSLACTPEGQTHAVIPGASCCAGLTDVNTSAPNADGSCTPAPLGVSRCTKCGDGVCGTGENKCNCSQDCPVACRVTQPPLCMNGILVPQLGPDANGCRLPPVCCEGANNPTANCSMDLQCAGGTCVISSCTCQ